MPELPPLARALPTDDAARAGADARAPPDDPLPADAAARAAPSAGDDAAADDAPRAGAAGASERADPAPADAAAPPATDAASFVRGTASAGTTPRGVAGAWPAVDAAAGFAERGATPVGHGTRSGSGGLEADCLSRACRGLTAGAVVFVPRASTCPGQGTRSGRRPSAGRAPGTRAVVRVGAPAIAGRDAEDVAGLRPVLRGVDRDPAVAGAAVSPDGLRRPASLRMADRLYVGWADATSPSSSPRRYRAIALG